MDSDFVKKLKKSKKTLLVIVSASIFYALLYYILFMSVPEPTPTPLTAAPTDVSYQEYRDYVSDSNKGVKALLDGDQLTQIKMFEQDPIEVDDVPRAANPFAQLF